MRLDNWKVAWNPQFGEISKTITHTGVRERRGWHSRADIREVLGKLSVVMSYVSGVPENMRSWHVVTCIYVTWSVYNTQLILTQARSCLLALLVENTEWSWKTGFFACSVSRKALVLYSYWNMPFKRVSRKLRPQTQKLKPPSQIRENSGPPKIWHENWHAPPPKKKTSVKLRPSNLHLIVLLFVIDLMWRAKCFEKIF